MKRNVLSFFVLILLLQETIQQLSLHLEYSRTDQPVTSNISRHHLLNSNIVHQHRKPSKLSHNVQFIKKHFAKSSQHSKISHQLRTTPDSDHLKLETFNLEPSIYAFSLPMKIAGLNYKMSIDSGSSDIFIKGEKAQGKPKKRYQCGQVCIDTHQHYTIGYLDGKLSTYQTKLEVDIGQHKFNESVLVAFKVQHNFQENQGLVGLSFSELAANPNPTFLQTLKNQKIIDSYAFGVNLNFQDKNRSFITFGSFDNQFFQGNLSQFPLTSHLFYYIKSKGVSIGNGSLLSISSALFDTGNTCISIPHQFEADILKQFNQGKGDKINQCFFSMQDHAQMFSLLRCKVGDFNALPTLNVHLGDKVFSIEKEYYLQACDRRPKDVNSNLKDDEGFWYCDTYIESVTGMSELFLGDGFFSRYYTYFNLDTKHVGIAKNKEIITVDRIKQNQLDTEAQDWQEMLTKLNQKESSQQIKEEINQAITESEKDNEEDSSTQDQ